MHLWKKIWYNENVVRICKLACKIRAEWKTMNEVHGIIQRVKKTGKRGRDRRACSEITGKREYYYKK